MKGKILAIEEHSGIIIGNNDQRFKFSLSEWKEQTPPQKGAEVDFEIDGENAKNIYCVNISTQINPPLSNVSLLGGIGTIFLLLEWIPYLGFVFYIAGIIMLSIAIKRISDYAPEKSIFTKWIISIVLGIGSLLLMGIVFGVLIAIIGSSNSDAAIGVSVILGSIVYIILEIILGILYKQIFYGIYEITGEKLFQTTGAIFFWGGILSIILVGQLLFLIGWILAAIAFFSIKPKN